MMKPRTLLVFSGITLIIALVGTSTATGQSSTRGDNAEFQAAANSSSLDQRIAQKMALIRDGEKRGLEPLKLGRLWAHLASDYLDAMELPKSEAAFNRALGLLEPLPGAQKDYAIVLNGLGSLYVMSGKFDESERCRKRALAMGETTGDKLEVARDKALLAEVYLARHKYKAAHREAIESYTEMVALENPNISEVISALVSLIFAECFRGECASALEHARQALVLTRSTFAADSLEAGQAHLALGFAEWKTGTKDSPEDEMRAGIEIMKARTSLRHPYTLSALEQYRRYLVSVHRKQEARKIAQELAQFEAAHPPACSSCTMSVYGLQRPKRKRK